MNTKKAISTEKNSQVNNLETKISLLVVVILTIVVYSSFHFTNLV